MTAKEARAKNLALLVKTKAGGKQATFASTFGFDAAHVSQMINYKTMGNKVAREIEKRFGMEEGAMDQLLPDDTNVEEMPQVALSDGEDEAIRRELMDYWKHLPGQTKRRLLADAKLAIASRLQAADRETAALRARLGINGSATDRRVAESIGHAPGRERRKQKSV